MANCDERAWAWRETEEMPGNDIEGAAVGHESERPLLQEVVARVAFLNPNEPLRCEELAE